MTILFIQDEIKFYGLEFIIELVAIRDCCPQEAHISTTTLPRDCNETFGEVHFKISEALDTIYCAIGQQTSTKNSLMKIFIFAVINGKVS